MIAELLGGVVTDYLLRWPFEGRDRAQIPFNVKSSIARS
jgi:hypothetical protein